MIAIRKKVFQFGLLVFLSSIMSTQLFAAQVISGVTFNGEVGYYSPSNSDNSVHYDDSSASVKLSAGFGVSGLLGYQYAINPYVALGAKAGVLYGISAGEKITSSASPSIGFNVSQTWSFPILMSATFMTPMGLYLMTEAGISFNQTKFTGIDSGDIAASTLNGNHDSTNPMANIAVGYQFADSLSLYLKYSHMFASFKKSSLQNLFNNNMYMLGFSYTFGD